MPGYLDSPQYQAMMAQILRGPQRGPQYPAEAGLNALADALQGYELRGMRKEGEARDAAVGQTYKDAFAPQVDPKLLAQQIDTQTPGTMENQSGSMVAPTQAQSIAKLLSNPDVANQIGPSIANSLIQSQAQASAPITPYQQQQLARQARLDDPDYKSTVAGRVAGAQANATLPADLEKASATQNFTAQQNQLSRDNQREVAGIRSGSVGSNVQSVQPLGDGTLLKVFRDGHTELTKLDGTPVAGARNDPKALFNQSAATSAGKAAGTAAEALPTTQANFDIINQTLDAFNDPAVKGQAGKALGFGGLLPTIPGVNSDFKSRVDQLQGQTFLQAFNTLRGGGQITEVEGAKATNAIARLQKAQTPDEFYSALREAKATFGTLFNAAKTRGGRGAVVPALQGPAPAAGGGGIDDLVNQYKTKKPQ